MGRNLKEDGKRIMKKDEEQELRDCSLYI